MSAPPAIASPKCLSAPLSRVPPSGAVRGLPSHPTPSAVITSSSVSNPNVSAPLLLELLSALSPSAPPLARYSSPAQTLLTWWPCSRLPLALDVVAVVAAVAVVLISAPGSLLVLPSLFLFLPDALAPPPPPSLRLLWPLALPRAPLLLAPAADIARKDEYVGDWTCGVEARWLVASGSASHRKLPSRPLSVVGDGIIRPRFLHLPQQ